MKLACSHFLNVLLFVAVSIHIEHHAMSSICYVRGISVINSCPRGIGTRLTD